MMGNSLPSLCSAIDLIKTNSPGGSLLIVFTKLIKAQIINGRIHDNKDCSCSISEV